MSVFLPPGKLNASLIKLPPMLIGVLGIALLSAACTTEPAKQSTLTASDKVASNEPKLKCRYIKTLGSNIPRKVCDTEANWEALNKKSENAVDEYTRKNRERATIPDNSNDGGGANYGPMGGT